MESLSYVSSERKDLADNSLPSFQALVARQALAAAAATATVQTQERQRRRRRRLLLLLLMERRRESPHWRRRPLKPSPMTSSTGEDAGRSVQLQPDPILKYKLLRRAIKISTFGNLNNYLFSDLKMFFLNLLFK